MSTNVIAANDEEGSLRKFFLAAVLWLPLAFFLWFALRSVVVFLPIRLALAWLSGWLPELVKGGSQDMFEMSVRTVATLGDVAGLPSNKLEVPGTTNALAYCYGLPILVGLVMATPLTWARTFAQIAIGYAAIFTVFLLLYRHAYKQRDKLGLNEFEIYETQHSIQRMTLTIVVGLLYFGIALMESLPKQTRPQKNLVLALSFAILAAFAVLLTRLFRLMRERRRVRKEWLARPREE